MMTMEQIQMLEKYWSKEIQSKFCILLRCTQMVFSGTRALGEKIDLRDVL